MITRNLFRSRWVALFWAAGMVWTAYDMVGAAPSATPAKQAAAGVDATGEPVDAAAIAALANAEVN